MIDGERRDVTRGVATAPVYAVGPAGLTRLYLSMLRGAGANGDGPGLVMGLMLSWALVLIAW